MVSVVICERENERLKIDSLHGSSFVLDVVLSREMQRQRQVSRVSVRDGCEGR
jgi:hypothetical protein